MDKEQVVAVAAVAKPIDARLRRLIWLVLSNNADMNTVTEAQVMLDEGYNQYMFVRMVAGTTAYGIECGLRFESYVLDAIAEILDDNYDPFPPRLSATPTVE